MLNCKQGVGVQGQCVVFLSKILHSHSASLHPGVYMGTSKFTAGRGGGGGGTNIHSCFMLLPKHHMVHLIWSTLNTLKLIIVCNCNQDRFYNYFFFYRIR